MVHFDTNSIVAAIMLHLRYNLYVTSIDGFNSGLGICHYGEYGNNFKAHFMDVKYNNIQFFQTLQLQSWSWIMQMQLYFTDAQVIQFVMAL